MREVCLGVLVLCVAHAQARGWQNESTPTSLADDAKRAGRRRRTRRGTRHENGRPRVRGHLAPLRVVGDVAIEVVFPDRYLRADRISLGDEVFRGGDRLQRRPADPAGQCGGRHSDRPLRKLAARAQESRPPIRSCRSPEGGRSVAPWVSRLHFRCVPRSIRERWRAPNRRTARRNSSTYARPTDCRHGCSSTRGHDCR